MKKNVLYLRISIICLLLITALVQLNAQNFIECAYIDDTTSPQALRSGCDNSSSTWITKYRSPGYWVPNDNTPIKTIMVNWVVCRDDNGLNGWQDIPEFHEQVDLMFSHINEWYSNSQPKGHSLTCEPNYTHVYDTKIRFELNEIIFIDNTEFNNNCWAANDLLDYIYQTYPGSEDIFTHIFTQPSSPCLGGAWGYYNTYTKNNTAYVQTWGSMWSPWFVVWDDHINHITHEYGHAVGLHHTYDGEYRCTSHYDFLDDVFGLCAEPTCAPCSAPPNCNGDHVCYFNAGCFWDN